MKHMIRKPMLALVLLAVMVFGTAFMAFFRADIAAGWEQVDRLYHDTQITVEILPEAGWDELQMKTHKSIWIEGMPEMADTLSVMECYYVLRDGTPLPQPEEGQEFAPAETHTIRGTNDIAWLAEYWGLEIEWGQGLEPDDFCVIEGRVPCLVRQELLDALGIEIGGVIPVSPTPWVGEVSPAAPTFELVVAGVCSDGLGRIGERDILVPEESFMGEPKLFYNGYMMYRCYYRAYVLRLNREYNREYDRVEAELESVLYDLSDYSFATNAQALENAARPLIQKLQMQELLVLPLSILLCAAAVVVAVLLGLSFEQEVFLRLMWGEKRMAVFLRLGGAVCLWLLACVGASCLGACVTAGTEGLPWAAAFSGLTAAGAAAGCAVPLLRACGSNLVKSYQSREGE